MKAGEYSLNLKDGYHGVIIGVFWVHFESSHLKNRAKLLCFEWEEHSNLHFDLDIWPLGENPWDNGKSDSKGAPFFYLVKVLGSVSKIPWKKRFSNMSGAKWKIQVEQFLRCELLNMPVQL